MVTAVNESSKEHNVYDFETDPKTAQDLNNEVKAMLIAICDAVVQSTTSDGKTNANEMKAAEAKDSANAAAAQNGASATDAKGSVQSQPAPTTITPNTKV